MPDSNGFVGRQTCGDEFRGLGRVILPVVIRKEKRSIVVAQLQRWIGQGVRHTQGSQARSDPAHDNPVIAGAVAQDEARNDDVAPRCSTKARVLRLASFEAAA